MSQQDKMSLAVVYSEQKDTVHICVYSSTFRPLKGSGISHLSFLVSFSNLKMLIVVWPLEGSLTQLLRAAQIHHKRMQ